MTDEDVERVAQAAYVSMCAVMAPDEPVNMGRGGFQTQAVAWRAVARAIIPLVQSDERAKVVALLDEMAAQHIDRNMNHKTPQDEGAFDALSLAAIRVKAGAHMGGDDVAAD